MISSCVTCEHLDMRKRSPHKIRYQSCHYYSPLNIPLANLKSPYHQ